MRIFEYAKVADWENRLSVLADAAEPERWTFTSVPDASPLPILDSYLRHTFERLSAQGKVAEGDGLACFNTGLLTPGQEELYGVFKESANYDTERPISRENRRWFLQTWARGGDRILTRFPALPGLATYTTSPAELIFDPSLPVQPNVDHIIRENLSRFPIELGGQVDVTGTPLDLQATLDKVLGDTVYEEQPLDNEETALESQGDDGEAGDDLYLPAEAAVPLATRIALDGAIQHSLRLARRSYRVAVPQFHRENIQLLLPLYLRDAEKADLALTLERHGDWYRAATVLYPDWAYRQARLLSRPNSEWLGGFRSDLAGAM